MELLNLKLLSILILYDAPFLVNAADFCEASRGTVIRVDKCPKNEVEWLDAASRKNCTALAGLCPEPDRFVYHCVLNFFLNETLEVCAYGRNILLGRCTEYSILGNLIQESRVVCNTFPKPCPVIYPSTEAYKYQDCYNLVQRPTTGKSTTVGLLTTVGEKTTEKLPMTTSSGDSTTSEYITERSSHENFRIGLSVTYVILLMAATIFIILFVHLWLRKRKQKRNATTWSLKVGFQNKLRTNLDDLPEPMMKACSEESNALLSPSGELLKYDTKDIEVHQEEETPVNELRKIQPKKVKKLLEQLDDVVEKLMEAKSAKDPMDETHIPKSVKHLFKADTQFSDEDIPLLQDCIQEVVKVNNYFEKRKHKSKQVKPV